MKAVDEKGRVFGKVHLFDLIVLLVLVLGVIFILLRPAAENTKEIQYESAVLNMKIKGVQQYIADAYEVGDTIYEDAIEIGTLKEIKITPQKAVKLMPDGSYREVERKLFYDVELVLETEQYYEKDGQYIGKKRILNGTTHSISNGIAKSDATVCLIQKEEEKDV